MVSTASSDRESGKQASDAGSYPAASTAIGRKPPPTPLDGTVAPAYLGVTMTKDTTQLWTVEQVADYLNLTENAVRKRVERETIPYRKVGRSLRFDPEEVEEWTKPNGGDPG